MAYLSQCKGALWSSMSLGLGCWKYLSLLQGLPSWQPGLSHCSEWGVGQAGRQLGQFWASCTSRGTELCWTISPQVGVKIRPNEGKQDHTPPWDGQTGPWGWDGLRMGQDGSLKVVPWNGCALSRCKHSCDTVVTADQARAQNESCSLKSPPKRMKGQPSLRPSIIAAWQPLPKGTSCTTLAISPVLQTPRVQWGSIQGLDCNFQGKYFL